MSEPISAVSSPSSHFYAAMMMDGTKQAMQQDQKIQAEEQQQTKEVYGDDTQ